MTAFRRLHRVTRHALLRPRETLLLDNARGTLLVVERGCLWVTLERDLRDIVLGPGMDFEIDRPGRTIVTAETASALRLRSPLGLRDRLGATLKRARRAGANVLAGWTGRLARRAAPHY